MPSTYQKFFPTINSRQVTRFYNVSWAVAKTCRSWSWDIWDRQKSVGLRKLQSPPGMSRVSWLADWMCFLKHRSLVLLLRKSEAYLPCRGLESYQLVGVLSLWKKRERWKIRGSKESERWRNVHGPCCVFPGDAFVMWSLLPGRHFRREKSLLWGSAATWSLPNGKGDEELGDVSELPDRFTCSWPSIHHSSIRFQVPQKTSSVESEDQKGLVSMWFALPASFFFSKACAPHVRQFPSYLSVLVHQHLFFFFFFLLLLPQDPTKVSKKWKVSLAWVRRQAREVSGRGFRANRCTMCEQTG